MTLEATLLRTDKQDIDRYCRLLATPLSDVEREYVPRRIPEQRGAIERIMAQLLAGFGLASLTPGMRKTNRPAAEKTQSGT